MTDATTAQIRKETVAYSYLRSALARNISRREYRESYRGNYSDLTTYRRNDRIVMRYDNDGDRFHVRVTRLHSPFAAWCLFALDAVIHFGKVDDAPDQNSFGYPPVSGRYGDFKDRTFATAEETAAFVNGRKSSFAMLFDANRKRTWFWRTLTGERWSVGDVVKL